MPKVDVMYPEYIEFSYNNWRHSIPQYNDINNLTSWYFILWVFRLKASLCYCVAMVNKCSVFGCFTNHEGHEVGTVFGLKSVKDLERKRQWFRFCNRNDLKPDGSVFVCAKHFEEKFMRRNSRQPRLIKKLFPIPTIQVLRRIHKRLPKVLKESKVDICDVKYRLPLLPSERQDIRPYL